MTKKKTWLLVLVSAIALGIYFLLFYKNKNLKYHPKDADIVILLDVKNISRHYIFQFLSHPSQWQKESGEDSDKTSFLKSGVKIPDFVEAFHLKNSDITDWYSVLELSDKDKFVSFLKRENFENLGNNTFRKNKIILKIIDENCLIKTGPNQNISALETFGKSLFSGKIQPVSAQQFIADSHASISFISGSKIHRFPIEIDHDKITIDKENNNESFDKLTQLLLKRNHFIEANFDTSIIKNVTPLLNNRVKNAAAIFPLIDQFSINSTIEEERDTIVTYEYDDNFNEVEKVSFQNLLQPKFRLNFQSSNPQKLQTIFREQKWISDNNQFSAIPFQPNVYSENGNKFNIQSKSTTLENPLAGKDNFFFLKNNEKLIRSLSSISDSEKEQLLKLSYLFFGSRNNRCFARIQFQKEDIPLILRF